MSVDAQEMGTTCVTVRTVKEAEMVMGAMGAGKGGLELIKDLTFDYELLEEGRELALVNEKHTTKLNDLQAVFDSVTPADTEANDGKLTEKVKLAFVNMAAVNKSCKNLAQILKDKDKEKDAAKKKEEREKRKEAGEQVSDDDEEIDIGGKPDYYYAHNKKEWVVPETTGQDSRRNDSRYVAGGTPESLGQGASVPAPRGDATKPKRITRYMTTEPDAKGFRKVYIEEPAVANCEPSGITVTFMETSYDVRVDTGSAVYALGPVECGHLDRDYSDWKLSRGKRLTITLAKPDYSGQRRPKALARPVEKPKQETVEPVRPEADSPKNQTWSTMFVVTSVLVLGGAVAVNLVLQNQGR